MHKSTELFKFRKIMKLCSYNFVFFIITIHTVLCISDFAKEVLTLTNEERKKAGVKELCYNDKLDKAATDYAQLMAKIDKLSHDEDGSSSDRVERQGYQFTMTGENIAQGQSTPKEVVTSWMNSPGHRENILNPGFEQIGIGFDPKLYWVQNFGASTSEPCSSDTSTGAPSPPTGSPPSGSPPSNGSPNGGNGGSPPNGGPTGGTPPSNPTGGNGTINGGGNKTPPNGSPPSPGNGGNNSAGPGDENC